MKQEIKVGVIVAVIEAFLALFVGYVLYLVQEDSIEQKTVEILPGYFDSVDESMSYDQVLKTLYEDSLKQENMISQLKEEAKLLESNKDREIAELKEAAKLLENEKDREIAELKEENDSLSNINEQFSSDKEVIALISSAQSFADSNDFLGALAVLNSITNRTPQIEAMISNYIEQYERYIATQAEALRSEKKYREAIKLIDDALKVLDNPPFLVAKRNEIQDSMLTSFVSVLSPYERNGYAERTGGQVMEMGGNKYSNGFQLGQSYHWSWAIYNLDAQYSILSGLIGHIDGSEGSDQEVAFYVDGVWKETIEIPWQDLPKEFSIDVSGCKQLKIQRSIGGAITGFADLMIG